MRSRWKEQNEQQLFFKIYFYSSALLLMLFYESNSTRVSGTLKFTTRESRRVGEERKCTRGRIEEQREHRIISASAIIMIRKQEAHEGTHDDPPASLLRLMLDAIYGNY